MFIIADMEWARNDRGEMSPTQLAAVCVDEKWNTVDQFWAFIRPRDASFHDWTQACYNAGTPADYLYANGCHKVFSSFAQWLREDDVLCWWNSNQADTYNKIFKIVLKREVLNRQVVLNQYMESFFNGERFRGSAYQVARMWNIDVPAIEHNARNDITAVQNLLRGISFSQELLQNPPSKPTFMRTVFAGDAEIFNYLYDTKKKKLHRKDCPILCGDERVIGFGSIMRAFEREYKPCSCVKEEYQSIKQKRTANMLAETDYSYLYLTRSKVFHHHSCSYLRRTVQTLEGVYKYTAAAETGRVPCKRCHPSVTDLINPAFLNRLTVKPSKSTGTKGVKKSATKKTPKKQTGKQASTSLCFDEAKALSRYNQSKKERFSGVLEGHLTKQERADLFTLTQPTYAFFAARGYQTFHLRKCPNLIGRIDICGFSTCTSARHAGFSPCRYCRPTQKDDVLFSIPITSRVREDETVEDLAAVCEGLGYPYEQKDSYFLLSTPVGKWKINTQTRPVKLYHINLVSNRGDGFQYHRQPRIFLSMLDTLAYIRRHDESLLREANMINSLGHVQAPSMLTD